MRRFEEYHLGGLAFWPRRVLQEWTDEFCSAQLSYLLGCSYFLLIQHSKEFAFMDPVVLFGIQFTLSLLSFSLIAGWYVVSRLSKLPKELALVPFL